MKTKILAGVVIIAGFFISIVTGFYPVAVVDGTLIFYRTWRKTDEAARHFANTQLVLRGEKPIDFSASENAGLLSGGKKETLTSLVEDAILEQEGKKFDKNFNKSVKNDVERALAGREDLEQAARLAYNLDWEDFKNLVLYPQARDSVMTEILSSRSQNFERWLGEAKKRRIIFLIFVPFRWDGERAQ